MSAPLEGKAAVVTGASRGIGAAIAERLRALGARVATLQRSDLNGVVLPVDGGWLAR